MRTWLLNFEKVHTKLAGVVDILRKLAVGEHENFNEKVFCMFKLHHRVSFLTFSGI